MIEKSTLYFRRIKIFLSKYLGYNKHFFNKYSEIFNLFFLIRKYDDFALGFFFEKLLFLKVS